MKAPPPPRGAGTGRRTAIQAPVAILIVLATLAPVAVAGQAVLRRTFDHDAIGAVPAGFVLAAGRDAVPGRWAVARDGGRRVLVHQGQAGPPDGFAVAVLSSARYDDVVVTVRLKASAGRRVAGLVWKYRDPRNHYALQLDLAEQELTLYRVTDGNRIRLEREDDLELDPDAWHSLRVRQAEGQVRVYLGGIRVFGEDARQMPGAAGVGLWVAGDTTAAFADLTVEGRAAADVRREGGP